MIRLFLSEVAEAFGHGVTIALNPDQSRYLAAVMRLGVGDELLVFNGRDGEWLARLTSIGKKTVTLELIELTRPQVPTNGPILAIAMVKRHALENIVEKATELGVGSIQLVITQHSNIGHTNIERLVSIAKEASEQTERLDAPNVLPPVKLDAWLRGTAVTGILFADEDSTHEGVERATLPALTGMTRLGAQAAFNVTTSAILIGPEGGFADSERHALRSDPRVQPINLGPRILRADTAAISAMTLFQAALGDWR